MPPIAPLNPYELTNRSSRASWAKTFAKIMLHGLRNNRVVLAQMIARGEDEFVRVSRIKLAHHSGLRLRDSDIRRAFRIIRRGFDQLYFPPGYRLPTLH